MFSISVGLQTYVDKISDWLRGLATMAPNIILAIIIIVLAIFIGKGVRKIAISGLPRVSHNRAVHRLIAGTLYVIVILAGIFLALNVLNLDKTVTSLLAGVGIVGIALGFAFQDIASNFIAGIILAVQKPFRVGDLIDTNTHFGKVQTITLRTTTIRTNDGLDVLIPNADIIGNPMVNFTKHDERRIEFTVGVAYDSDLEKVRKVTEKSIEGSEELLPDRDIDVFFTGFGDSSIDLIIRFWIPISDQGEYLRVRSIMIQKLKKAYDANDITIPFPIRTIEMNT